MCWQARGGAALSRGGDAWTPTEGDSTPAQTSALSHNSQLTESSKLDTLLSAKCSSLSLSSSLPFWHAPTGSRPSSLWDAVRTRAVKSQHGYTVSQCDAPSATLDCFLFAILRKCQCVKRRQCSANECCCAGYYLLSILNRMQCDFVLHSSHLQTNSLVHCLYSVL